jgi:hypothetical protein
MNKPSHNIHIDLWCPCQFTFDNSDIECLPHIDHIHRIRRNKISSERLWLTFIPTIRLFWCPNDYQQLGLCSIDTNWSKSNKLTLCFIETNDVLFWILTK